MLNDIKDCAIEKDQETKELTQGVAEEVQNNSVMDWSGSAWLVLGVIAVFVVIGLSGLRY